jgi:hypothetical protein
MNNRNEPDLSRFPQPLQDQINLLAQALFGHYERIRLKPAAPRSPKNAPLAYSRRRHTTANEAMRREEASQRDAGKSYHAAGYSFYCPPSQVDPELECIEQHPIGKTAAPPASLTQPIRDQEIKDMVRNTPRKSDEQVRQEFGIKTLADEILQALNCKGEDGKPVGPVSAAPQEKPAVRLTNLPEKLAPQICRYINEHYKVRPYTLPTGSGEEILYIPGDTDGKVRRNIARYLSRQLQNAGK